MQIRIKFAADGEVLIESSGGDRDIESAKMKVEGVSLLEFSNLRRRRLLARTARTTEGSGCAFIIIHSGISLLET